VSVTRLASIATYLAHNDGANGCEEGRHGVEEYPACAKHGMELSQHNYFEAKDFPLYANVTATDMFALAKYTLFDEKRFILPFKIGSDEW
jgi:hypothetical protein